MSSPIRIIVLDDAESITALSVQLGYYPSVKETMSYIQVILNSENDIAYVAISDNNVVGWIHIFITTRLESGTFAEIGGLVVEGQSRGKGIGRSLIDKAIQWGKEKQVTKLKVRTNTKRIEAHKFYHKFGFVELKEQKIFELYL